MSVHAALAPCTGPLILAVGRWNDLHAHVAPDRQIADLTDRLRAHPDDSALFLRRGELHRETLSRFLVRRPEHAGENGGAP